MASSHGKLSPCVDLSAPRFEGRGCRSWYQKSVKGAPWLPASAPRPAEQDFIARAHRLTDYSRLRAARGAIPIKGLPGPHSESGSAGNLGNYPTQRRLAECPSRGIAETQHGHPARERFFSFLVMGRGKPSNDFMVQR